MVWPTGETDEGILEEDIEAMVRETPEERKEARRLLKGFLQENAQDSSKRTSSSPRDLVELVMQRHGFTREEAEEEIEKFGG